MWLKKIFFLKEGEELLQHVTMGYNALQDIAKTTQPKHQFESCPKVLFFLKEVISYYSVLQQVTMRYKKSQKVGMCTTFNVAKEIFFLKEGEKLLQHVTTSCNALQEVTKTTQHKDQFDSCSKVPFFLKEGTSCYNVLQQVTMRYKRLQNNAAQGLV